MRLLAAFCAGIGGLLIELAAVRRIGLLLGNTAEAAAVVVAIFLLGLGVGGLWVARNAALRGSPRRSASSLYSLVALLVVVGDGITTALPPLGWFGGLLVVLIHPGLAACAMGAAFALLFTGRAKSGSLIAVNLLGSVIACAFGATLLIPEIGLTDTHRIGAALYLLAGLAALLGLPESAESDRAVGEVTIPRFAYRSVALAGFATVGFEVLLLRRLPFFLEGFQPTMSGVLAVCLLALSVGAAFVAPVYARFVRGAEPRLRLALLVAAIAMCLGIHEYTGGLAKTVVTSDFGMHARIWFVALLAAGPACLLLGAVVPLAIDVVDAPAAEQRSLVAGRLFCAQGVGSVAGAVFAGHVVPWIAPSAYFALLPLALGLVVVASASAGSGAKRAPIVSAAVVLLLGITGLAGAGRAWDPTPPVFGSRFDRPGRFEYLEHSTDSTVTASIVYDRAKHSMVLFTNEFRAAYTGPDTAYMKVLGHLPFLLRRDLRDVAVIALGTGTTADAVCAWPQPERVHVVEISPAVLSLVDRFAGDGPVPTELRAAFLEDPRTSVHVTDGRRWLMRQPDASLDLVTMEPLLPYAPGTAPLYSLEFYEAARQRLRDDGMLVQWVPTHSMPEEFFATLLATFGRAFEHSSVWLVDQSTLLVGSKKPHLPDPSLLDAAFDSLPPAVADTLHEAGIASVVDLEAAFLGTELVERFEDASTLVDDRPFLEHIGYWDGADRLLFYPDNLRQLTALVDESDWWGAAAPLRRERLRGLIARAEARLPTASADDLAGVAVHALTTARAQRPRSVLLHREETIAWRAARERRARVVGGAGAAKAAERQLERDESSAFLHACRGLRDPQRVGSAAARAAIAVDPTIFEGPLGRADPLGLVWVSGPYHSPLGDIAELPDSPGELVGLAVRNDAQGVSLRAVYPVRCALAACRLAASGPVENVSALRSTFDPASLDRFAAAVRARRGDLHAEVGPLWRHDLPMPRALGELLEGSPADRIQLAELLAGHRGPAAIDTIASLLEDGEMDVRQAAFVALHQSVRDAVLYDPMWSESRRTKAARELRRLHNQPR